MAIKMVIPTPLKGFGHFLMAQDGQKYHAPCRDSVFDLGPNDSPRPWIPALLPLDRFGSLTEPLRTCPWVQIAKK